MNFIQLNNNKSTKTPKHFHEIRKQVIWGNRFIKYKGKCLVFHSWINSDLIFINDILNKNGKIDETIFNKLIDHSNWISELFRVKHAIPNSWKEILKSESSIKTAVKNDKTVFGSNINIAFLNNQDIRNKFIKLKFEPPYMHNAWENKFKCTINWNALYSLINDVFVDNRVKQLRIKIIHKIVANNENLFLWKLVDSPLCKHCNEFETNDHFFIECSYIRNFWITIHNIFKKCGISRTFGMYEIVIGYKIMYKFYQEINILLSHVTFAIYKSYMMSERRTKPVNMLLTLYDDLFTLEKYYQKKAHNVTIVTKFIKELRSML